MKSMFKSMVFAGVLAIFAVPAFAQIGMFDASTDIGDVGVAGSASFSGDTYTVEGSGADIWGSADAFHFLYTQASGPFSMRVEAGEAIPLASTNDWVKVGLMVRQDLDPNSVNAFACVRADNGYRPQYRATKGGGSAGPGDIVDFGEHLGTFELERIGDTVNFYHVGIDADGNDVPREFFGSAPLSELVDPVYIGLAVTSHQNDVLSQGIFSGVTVTPYSYWVERSLPGQTFPWKGGITGAEVTLKVVEGNTVDVTITETAPAGWTISNVATSTGNASVSGNVITWTVNGASADATLTYDAASAADEVDVTFSGAATGDGLDLSIIGPSRLFADAPEGFTTVLDENFDGRRVDFGPQVHETHADPADLPVWTNVPPAGWEIINEMPGLDDDSIAYTEWQGWSFADVQFWIDTNGQRREEFTFGNDVIATVDPDEWDDRGSPGGLGTFNSDLITPDIDISARQTDQVILTFDSSWRPEDTQSARLSVSYDGGEFEDVFVWLSDSASPNYKDDNSTNEKLFIQITAPSGASSMKLNFAMFDATNDWWWTIDNIKVSIDAGDTAVNQWSLF